MPRIILLADDSITIQKVVELTFSDGDYQVIATSNGERAIQKLSEVRPDIVLSDIIMPEKNGYEVCEYVKSHPELRHIPVILLTGTFEPFDPDRAEKAGCDAVVTKPFESQSLIQKVEELIERAGASNDSSVSIPSPAEPDESFGMAADDGTQREEQEDEPRSVSQPAGARDDGDNGEEPGTPLDLYEPFDGGSESPAERADETPESIGAEDQFDRHEVSRAFAETGNDDKNESSFAPRASSNDDARSDDPGSGSPFEMDEPFPAESGASDDDDPWASDEDEHQRPEASAPWPVDLESPEDGDANESGNPPPTPFDEVDKWDATDSGSVENDSRATLFEHESLARPQESPVETEEETFPEAGQDYEEVVDVVPAIQENRASEPPIPQQISAGSLSEEQIEQIARRVVELISENEVRKIAWEVVPELAEMIVRQRIRELESETE